MTEAKKQKRIPPLSVRLTPQEIEQVNQDCRGYRSRNDYMRERLLCAQVKGTSKRALAKDRQALSQILALLGSSRIANNLNQLAYHANMDSLLFTPKVKKQIQESYEEIRLIRQLLMKALGYKKDNGGSGA